MPESFTEEELAFIAASAQREREVEAKAGSRGFPAGARPSLLKSEAAFSQLYEMYLPKIFAYVTRRIGDRDEAEDLTSNIFVRVLENMKKFDPKKSSFKTWTYTIATRMMIDYFRAHAKKRTESLEMAENISDPQKNPNEQTQENQQREKVLSAIDKLSDRHQRVLMLKFFSGFSTPELALALGVTENNASVMVHRALQDFQTTYQRYV